jgi:hypothetical protein
MAAVSDERKRRSDEGARITAERAEKMRRPLTRQELEEAIDRALATEDRQQAAQRRERAAGPDGADRDGPRRD